MGITAGHKLLFKILQQIWVWNNWVHDTSSGEGKFYTVLSETQISQSEVRVAHYIGKKDQWK